MNVHKPSGERDYMSIADHGLIGNLRTAALVSVDGSIESYCIPNFDSPSVFARILDKDKGGHFSITPTVEFTTKQNYLPSSNVLQTKFMNNHGVVSVTDFLPRQANDETTRPLLYWLIRRVEVIRGTLPLRVECAPAFNYARDEHTTEIVPDDSIPGGAQNKVTFKSKDLSLDLRYVVQNMLDGTSLPDVDLKILDLTSKGHLGLSAFCDLNLEEGQRVTFVLRIPPDYTAPAALKPSQQRADDLGISLQNLKELMAGASKLRPQDDPILTPKLLDHVFIETNNYWNSWIRRSTYQGSWKEAVHRSALALKLLIFEPTGAVVASPTFSLPEYIGGTRNWDYRASWIRDSSFTLYALIRLGFTQEANAYMDFIFERLKDKNPDGSLQIMYTIHGGKDLEEIELNHLDGHKGSKPVRIGNGAADHVQLDIYGELMDCIYLGQKFGRPLSYDTWVLVRELVDFVVANYQQPDLSIWEVRGKKRHFTYSKIMLWVAIDRGLRLADKRSLPCPKRNQWLAARDDLYEEIMHKAWNPNSQVFGQSYEETDVLDSSVLIMPLVFFMTPCDPRFVNTLKQILKTPERGGLTSNNLVYRYDVNKSDDGVGGEEGTFCLCTLWCVEALTRAGEYDRKLLQKAISMFEDFLLYSNHVGLCTEEISEAGEGLGNAVQGFTHVTLISAAYNLSRTMGK
ncbi:glycoside hydrolase family 15 protein [Serpula lacrymans var. lacrymans S7.3]|uniref:Glycoside hydrolase family 15 protein n=2 Tax=Serpula lacrymans var. lacrymans TaxID=341189 RepID=F8Q0A3_SERL3|nr:glycoside hydrolase family 15 protein [Serpula lacrymans var. lacrymans S7.9]EGN97770.1 glycoside hydrolase family 15 protein [Serpula lacrymans var. lacrymans S7.3]EGO23364.1 glycoside hydrolase family 15 protein [Serpula lacrymans var. lacrymans S7.9]